MRQSIINEMVKLIDQDLNVGYKLVLNWYLNWDVPASSGPSGLLSATPLSGTENDKI